MTTEQQAVAIAAQGERELRFERVFNAPRETVWRTFTDPALIAEWWGGGAKVEEMDVRVGGKWRFLSGYKPDGGKFVFHGEYLEVDPPRRLVQTMVNGWMRDARWVEAMEFEDLDGQRTRFTQTSTFETVDLRDEVLESAAAGANFTYGRLDRVLDRLMSTQD